MKPIQETIREVLQNNPQKVEPRDKQFLETTAQHAMSFFRVFTRFPETENSELARNFPSRQWTRVLVFPANLEQCNLSLSQSVYDAPKAPVNLRQLVRGSEQFVCSGFTLFMLAFCQEILLQSGFALDSWIEDTESDWGDLPPEDDLISIAMTQVSAIGQSAMNPRWMGRHVQRDRFAPGEGWESERYEPNH